jgi:hypothetical protein
MTCGLIQVGSPGEEDGQQLPLHGRAHHLPARQIAAGGRWAGDDYEMVVSGVIEETAIFRESLRLTRWITSRLGENRIAFHDEVENLAFEPTPHMILYHFNFGFPLLGEETTVEFPSRRVIPREPETPVEGYDRWEAPRPGYRERVYYHQDFAPDPDGRASVTIRNPRFPLAGGGTCALVVRLTWATGTLPKLVQWKMPGPGVHVLGIEPANCYVEGRTAERQRGTLVELQPGEVLTYELELEVRRDE